MKREGIELVPSNFKRNSNEAQQLSKFYTQLVEFIDSEPTFQPILTKNQKKSFEEFRDIPVGEISLKFQFVNVCTASSEVQNLGPRVGKRIVNVSVGFIDYKATKKSNVPLGPYMNIRLVYSRIIYPLGLGEML